MSNSPSQTSQQPQLGVAWFDLKSSIQVAETPRAFERQCDLHRVAGLDSRVLEALDPDLAVIEFDYPSRADMDRAANARCDLAAEAVETTGFTVVFRTWGDSRIGPPANSDANRLARGTMS